MAHTGHFDGGSRGNPGNAGAGWVLRDPGGEVVDAGIVHVGDNATNNVSEYTGLIGLLEGALGNGVEELEVRGDSKLAVMQVLGKWRCKARNLEPLRDRVRALVARFTRCNLEHVRREENKDADALSNLAMDRRATERGAHLMRAVQAGIAPPEPEAGKARAVRIRRTKDGRVVQGCDVWTGGDFHKGGWHLDKSPWFNPFSPRSAGTAANALHRYKGYLAGRPSLLRQVHELRGKTLGCFCQQPSATCHAAWLARLAEDPEQVERMLAKLPQATVE